jgi:hypothetical protein
MVSVGRSRRGAGPPTAEGSASDEAERCEEERSDDEGAIDTGAIT